MSPAAMNSGLAPFITLEGGEGAGKSTQVRMLERRIRALGVKVEITRQPGATRVGAAIRRLVTESAASPPAPRAELLLYLADRADHVEKMILPQLQKGTVIICDRFADSSEIYQGHARGLGVERVRKLNRWVCGPVWPDLTLVLDIDPEAGLKRVMQRQGDLGLSRLEKEDMSFHEAVREGFHTLAENEPERVRLIDASYAPDEVAGLVWEIAEPLLSGWRGHAA